MKAGLKRGERKDEPEGRRELSEAEELGGKNERLEKGWVAMATQWKHLLARDFLGRKETLLKGCYGLLQVGENEDEGKREENIQKGTSTVERHSKIEDQNERKSSKNET